MVPNYTSRMKQLEKRKIQPEITTEALLIRTWVTRFLRNTSIHGNFWIGGNYKTYREQVLQVVIANNWMLLLAAGKQWLHQTRGKRIKRVKKRTARRTW